MRIGIMSAMQEENSLIIAKMESVEKSECAGRVYAEGCFCGMDVVIAFSRWGKVAASITASHLLTHHNDLLRI
ncbi:MAG: hypothetical protein KDK48_01400 [Chlamydiia bacterium]|nr:hypothetical protein [Chlamydiia bacterium]